MIECRYPFDNTVNMRLFKSRMKKVIILPILAGLVFVGLGIFSIIVSEDIFLGVVLLVAGVAVVPISCFAALTAQKSMSKSMNSMQIGAEVYLCIDQRGVFQQLIQNEQVTSQSTFAYPMFQNAVETKDEFFLYLSKAQAVVIPKSAIFTGTADELRALLAQYMTIK